MRTTTLKVDSLLHRVGKMLEIKIIYYLNYKRPHFLFLRHLVSTIKIGPGGIVHNYGIPKLSKLELTLFEKATLLLQKREQLVLDLLSQLDVKPSSQVASMIQLSPYSQKQTPAGRD